MVGSLANSESSGESWVATRAASLCLALFVVATVGCAKASIESEDTGPRNRGDTHTPPPDTHGAEDTGADTADTAMPDTGEMDAADGTTDGAETGLDVADGGDTVLDTADVADGGDDAGDTTDTGGDDAGDVGPCNGRCGSNEICEMGVCVNVCDNVKCGEVEYSGQTFQCGHCGNNKYCDRNQCRNICSASGADCGQVFWGGEIGSCGGCSGSKTCANNRCAQSGHHAITGGFRHTCATEDNGNATCWGGDDNNQLGNGGGSSSTTPTGVDTNSSLGVLRSLNSSTCAVTAGGGGECWGLNHTGQLGDGSKSSRSSPVAVQNLSQVVDISAGNLHACAVLSTGDVKCWGEQTLGRLGNGKKSSGQKTSPVDVKQINNAVRVSAGGDHTCALRSDGKVSCWGSGQYGVLGNGSFSNGSSTPVEVNKLDHAVDVSAGDAHTCAVTWSGEVWCWGNGNDYRLGNAKKSNKAVPVKAKNLSDIVAVAAGKSHSCAFDTSGEMYCWGKNGHGQIGNGTQNTASTPTNVKAPSSSSNVALSDIMAIGVGNRHSCAVKTSGKAFCWGDDEKGQLGTDQVSDFTEEPVEVQ